MPSIVGPIRITSVDGGGVINFGDSFYLSPKSSNKTSTGSGALNTGEFVATYNGISATNTVDPDVADQPSSLNA